MTTPQSFRLIGLMSGSSLDGIDLACCWFELAPDRPANPILSWKLEAAETIPFSAEWQERLRKLPHQDAATYCRTDVALGELFGQTVQAFITRHHLQPDAVASHGHTIFHFPEDATTAQIGAGAAIAAATGLTTIDNFRAMDMALGGQGAPLAPKADQLLFPDFDFWLNLGGIANISCRMDNRIIAFDLTGANQVLNALVAPLGLLYDDQGRIAAGGRLIPELLATVEALPFFRLPFPKSLGNDWVQTKLLPLFLRWEGSTEDKLHTAVVHVARQIADAVARVRKKETKPKPHCRMLVTGGGAFNQYLISCVEQECQKNVSLAVEIPATDLVQFKEAALMALLGALRLAEMPNCLASVTGARFDAVGGSIHWGSRKSTSCSEDERTALRPETAQ